MKQVAKQEKRIKAEDDKYKWKRIRRKMEEYKEKVK